MAFQGRRRVLFWSSRRPWKAIVPSFITLQTPSWTMTTALADFFAFDCLTERGFIRQEGGYLPLPRLGEGRGEALAVGSQFRLPHPAATARGPPQGEVTATL